MKFLNYSLCPMIRQILRTSFVIVIVACMSVYSSDYEGNFSDMCLIYWTIVYVVMF